MTNVNLHTCIFATSLRLFINAYTGGGKRTVLGEFAFAFLYTSLGLLTLVCLYAYIHVEHKPCAIDMYTRRMLNIVSEQERPNLGFARDIQAI